MARVFSLARMNTATTGTGAITLGSAVAGFLSFSAAGVTDGMTLSYGIKDGSSSEVGRGTYSTSGTQLTRSVLRSTNSNNPINLSGSAEVFITAVAEDFGEWGKNHDANGFNLGFDNATGITDDSSNEQLIFGKTASAVNNFRMTNAATGNAPALSVEGDDTNIDLSLAGKGTGKPVIGGSAILKASGVETLTGGFAVTPYSAGTKSSGTFTPVSTDGNFQYAVNGGAHTLAPPATNCNIVVQYTNNGSAGAITTSGFTRVFGAPTTVNGDDFFAFITRNNGFTSLMWVPLQ